MTKSRVYVSFDGINFFWIIAENRKIINKNPTKEDLYGTKLKSYNSTNICSRCREENEIDGKELTDKSILYPGNVSQDVDKEGKNIDEYVCKRHYGINYEKYNPNSRSNIIKSLGDRRTGNLKYDIHIFGDNCQELTCRVFGVEDLNKKNDNYNSPIDNSAHPILGVLQTKGSHFSKDIGVKGGWKTAYGVDEYKKEYDNMIFWCMNEDGEYIEMGYIIPKKEINVRRSVTILKDPATWPPWYDKYRMRDEEELKKINDIWMDIIRENSKKNKERQK